MRKTIKKTVKWLLCGGAFVAVVTATGCSSPARSSRAPATPLVDPYRAPAQNTEDRFFDNQDSAEAKPPVINIFGEMDGKSPQSQWRTVCL